METFHTPGPLAIHVEIPSGSIEVDVVEGEEAAVDVVPLPDGMRIELRQRGEGHELVVQYPSRRFGFLFDEEVHVRITCPAGANLRAQTKSADLTARGRLGSLEVKAASGDVAATELTGDASVKSASGDVELESVDGSVTVHTASGDVEVGRAGGAVSIAVVSGDVRVGDAAASVSARSVSGDIDVQAVAEGQVKLDAVSGDLTVGVRRGSRLWVDAKSLSGSTSSELDLDQAPTGGEGPLVELRANTVNGDIRVVRAPAELPAASEG